MTRVHATAPPSAEAAVTLRGVTKTFGETTAVAGLDLTIPRGALYGFIGPNGAGKTTSIRLIMSILFPDVGEVRVLGHSSALDAKDRIGYLPEERGVYRKMRVNAYLTFIAKIKGVAPKTIPARIKNLLERVGLPGVADKKCEEMSKGMLQKIQFAAAIIHEPDLLILDEPFSGLDPVSSRLLTGSRPLNGSSRIRRSGSWMMAAANWIFCSIPFDISSHFLSATPGSPTRSSRFLMRAGIVFGATPFILAMKVR